jgi:nicotinamidase/pyrazinamidase
MSKIKKILIAVVVLIIGIAGFLISQIMIISQPTEGVKIAKYQNPQKAVLVIDIQEDFTGVTAKPPFPYRDSQKLIDTVNTITEYASQRNIPVIYIRQELDGFIGTLLSNLFAGGTAIKGNPGTEIDKRVNLVSSNIYPKPKSDAFSNQVFEEFLIRNQINELYLVGLDADGCVHNTALGALNRGYTVNIVTDAIVLKEEEKWNELLGQYKKEGIKLTLTREFISS